MFSSTHKSSVDWLRGVNKRQSSNALPALQSVKTLEPVRVRYLHRSTRTEAAYSYWIQFFIRWSGMRHPPEIGGNEVRTFLTFLAVKRDVSVSQRGKTRSR